MVRNTDVVSLSDWRAKSELAYALDMARDVPVSSALQVAQERPDDRRALLIATFALIAALAGTSTDPKA